jgi:hypothetical protein
MLTRAKLLLACIAISVCMPSQGADGKVVYYCISEKLLGIQASGAQSGELKGGRQKFTLAYYPARILYGHEDPYFESPRIVYAAFSEEDLTYHQRDLASPFEQSFQRLSETFWFKNQSQDAKEKFNSLIKSTEGEITFAAFGSIDALSSTVTTLWKAEPGKVFGLATTQFPVNVANRKKYEYKLVGYMRYFTCTSF